MMNREKTWGRNQPVFPSVVRIPAASWTSVLAAGVNFNLRRKAMESIDFIKASVMIALVPVVLLLGGLILRGVGRKPSARWTSRAR